MKQSSFIVVLLSAKKHIYVLSVFMAMFLGNGFVYAQNSNPPKNANGVTSSDSLAKANSKAKQKNVPDSLRKGQKEFKPEKASTNNGDNNPLKKPE